MKKYLVFILLAVFIAFCLSACCGCGGATCSPSKNSSDEDNIPAFIESGVFSEKYWDDPALSYDFVAVPDANVALEIAEAVFDAFKDKGYGAVSGQVPQSIFFDTEDEVWIVSFWENQTGDVMKTDGDFNIAIQKSDGKVLTMWIGG